MRAMARVLLGVTGGIAAYKACELTRLLVKAGHDVVPLVTRGAEEFVTAKTFAALARRPAGEDPYPHLEHADLLVVAPCTANTLAKLAQGIADNVLTEAALAHRGPVLVAPAMNHRMWAHSGDAGERRGPCVERGVELIGPEEGELAEGESGIGRMSEPEDIFRRVTAAAGAAGPRRKARARLRRRHARAARRRPLPRQPLLRPDGRRARRGGAPPRRPRHAARGKPRRRAARTASRSSRRRPRKQLLHEALARADADLVLMSAAVADYRPAEASEREARQRRRAVDDPSSSRPRTSSRRSPPGARTAR